MKKAMDLVRILVKVTFLGYNEKRGFKIIEKSVQANKIVET